MVSKPLTPVYSDEVASHFRGAFLVEHHSDALGSKDGDLPTRPKSTKLIQDFLHNLQC